jgi:site-specific DNA recombinase
LPEGIVQRSIAGCQRTMTCKAKAALAEQERRRAKKAEYNRRYMEKKRRQWKEQQEREKEQQEALELPAASTEKGERIA